MMKKIVATLFFVSLFLAALLLVAPSLINWDKHKERIIAQIQPYLAPKIDVKGKVSFSLLPSPQILLEDVSLSNVEGSKADSLMTLQRLEAKMKFEPLLQGKFEVENINLANPVVNLEVLDDGSVNWTGIVKEQETPSAIEGDAIRLNKVTMTNGALRYKSQVTGAEWSVENLNLDISADTLSGPYRAAGQMKYGETPVGVEMSTGKAGEGGEVPVTINLSPSAGMPKVSFEGTVASAPELAVTGSLAVTEGKLSSIVTGPFFRNMPFMDDTADVKAQLQYKGREAKLTDIDAKFGEKGTLKGSLAIAFEKGKKPLVTAVLEGSHLKVAGKPGFLATPENFDASLKLKGKAITWAWAYMQGVTLAATTDKEEWVVKEGRFDMAGKSLVKIAGVVSPAKEVAAFTVMVTSDEFQKLAKALAMGNSNILKSVGESGVVKKLDMSASLDVKKDALNLFDIDAQFDGGTKMSGRLDINSRKGDTPEFVARLTFDQGDIGLPFKKDFEPLSLAMMKAKGEVHVNVRSFSRGAMHGQDLNFNATLDNGKMQVVSFLSMNPSFNMRGTVTGFSPLTGMDLQYEAQREKLGMFADAFGFTLPPPLQAGQSGKVEGTVTGDAGQFNFTFDGALDNGHVELQGRGTQDNDGNYSFENNLSIKRQDNGVWAQLGLPIDKLVEEDGQQTYKLEGRVIGSANSYKIQGIRTAGVVSAALARAAGKYEGDIEANKLDFDSWLHEGYKVSDKLALNLTAKQMEWRSNDFTDVKMKLEATGDSLKVGNFDGKLWGGVVSAQVEATKADSWKGKMKGAMHGAFLAGLMEALEFHGVKLSGNGDMDFNLSQDDSKSKDDWFAGVAGDISLRADAVTVEAFSPAKFSAVIGKMPYAPDDFAAQAATALGSADTTYKDVAAKFKVGDSKITIDKLKLADESATTVVTGAYSMGPETYDISAEVQMKNSPLTPYFDVKRAGEMGKASAYSLDLEALENYIGHIVKEPGDVPPPKTPIEKPVDAPPENLRKPIEQPPAQEKPIVIENHDAVPQEQGEMFPEEGGVDDTAPIESEDLIAPPTPSPDQPGFASDAPATPAPKEGNGDIKGILDRLDTDKEDANAPPPMPSPDGVQKQQ